MTSTVAILPPSDIDARWLTDVLQMNGVDAVVGAVEKKNVGTGQIGESVRFKLSYARDADGAPRSIVGKFPSPGETSRATGRMLGNYWREVRFYQKLAPRALISLPRCWYTEIDEASHDFVLIMEDLAPAAQGDQLKGVTLDQARLVMEEAAKLHASFWENEELDTYPWVSNSKAALAAGPGAIGPEMIMGAWGMFKQRYEGRLKPEWIEVGDTYAQRFEKTAALHQGPRCLAHLDFRPDNMMFASAAGGKPFTMLDWQSFAFGCGAIDVAYFLAGAISKEERRAHEPALLAHYHGTLTGLGVKGYDFAAFMDDYRTGAFQLFVTAYFAAVFVNQTERGDEMFLAMIRGAVDHIQDHGALDRLI